MFILFSYFNFPELAQWLESSGPAGVSGDVPNPVSEVSGLSPQQTRRRWPLSDALRSYVQPASDHCSPSPAVHGYKCATE